MSSIVISAENLSKVYRLGQIGTGTLRDDLHAWWARVRRQPNPLRKVGAEAHVEKWEQTLWALKDVDLEAYEGEALGIIGLNGAGKSTLLKILSKVTAPSRGEVKIRGRVASLLEVGTGFHPELTGRENIHLNGAILGMSRIEIARKFDEIVDFSGVEEFIDTPVKRYSSGMYVRLAFAVAAHLEPEILLVDEVLAVGDVAFQKKCLGKMGDVAHQGRTVLFVSHNMPAVTSLTARCVWLDSGRVQEIGSTPDLVASYQKAVSWNENRHGFASLISTPRPRWRGIDRKAQFEWVRLADNDGHQRGVFAEQEPIVVEMGIRVLGTARDLQFGLGVLILPHGLGLFSVASPIYPKALAAGHYRVQMRIDPNYLRAGGYSLVLKMFADEVRQETLDETLRFNIMESGLSLDDSGYYRTWNPGPLTFDYEWGRIEPGQPDDDGSDISRSAAEHGKPPLAG